jgi:hypothetical protein
VLHCPIRRHAMTERKRPGAPLLALLIDAWLCRQFGAVRTRRRLAVLKQPHAGSELRLYNSIPHA